jgi:ABC-type Zn uptake system ZnuABC Zn-binding protein ZnuA
MPILRINSLFILLSSFICVIDLSPVNGGESSEAVIKLLCTTFPIYQIARNVVAGSEDVTGELSAAGLIKLIEIIRREKPVALFTEPQYQGKAAQTLRRETGIPLFIIDHAANGPSDAPLDYYETVMRKKLAIMETALDGK